jgi:hypothetical protein
LGDRISNDYAILTAVGVARGCEPRQSSRLP